MRAILILRMLALALSVVALAISLASAPVPAPPPVVFIVFFDFGSSALTDQGRHLVADVATMRRPTVVITGYSDASEPDPDGLARRRANAVHQALVAAGAPQNSITVQSKGGVQITAQNNPGVQTPHSRVVIIDLCHKPVRCRDP